MNWHNYKIINDELRNHSHLFWVQVIFSFQKYQLVNIEKCGFLMCFHKSLIDHVEGLCVPRKCWGFQQFHSVFRQAQWIIAWLSSLNGKAQINKSDDLKAASSSDAFENSF